MGSAEYPGDSEAFSAEELRQPFENLIADGRRRLEQVEETLDQIDLQYRGRSEERSYRQFMTALRLANQAATNVLTEAERRFEVTPQAHFDKVQTLMKRLAREHEKHVESLRSSRAEAIQIFSQPFTRMAKRLLPNAEVLFFGWKLERYEIRVYDAETAGEFDNGAAAYNSREFGEDFQFLQFLHPVLRQTDLFQHPVFGHELAHPVIRQQPPPEVIAALEISIDSPTYTNVAVEYAHRQSEEQGVKRDKQDRKLLEDWFKEIACDIIAMRLLGPVFAIAFSEVTSVNSDLERSGSNDKQGYPPTRMRQTYLEQELKRFTFPAPWDERLPQVLSRSIASKIESVDPDEQIQGASDWMKLAVGAFRTHCVSRLVEGQELRPPELSDRYAEISALIGRGVPPAERLLVTDLASPASSDELGPWSEEYDWRLILNVARIGLLDPENDWELGRAGACRLATGAIEMAEFQRRARKLSRQYQLIGDLSAR